MYCLSHILTAYFFKSVNQLTANFPQQPCTKLQWHHQSMPTSQAHYFTKNDPIETEFFLTNCKFSHLSE